ncbi:hypothetical protein HCN44_010067 [Aphidius gifuensis]|uniref:TRASH domain-containing protein n=1 Tax=Aphidius gifuensis TaxID=684658 RepID=A0A834XXJ0_APHGI|nr:uncharacterized protein LOC122851651 [Aphidius gifuensis]XP_044006945.1 uncharacterized protein LOC122851651 [Aphidius gifuensis]KAF7993472.1 hypothetical protein HCN44_010067 [Aphidius gifuensis]
MEAEIPSVVMEEASNEVSETVEGNGIAVVSETIDSSMNQEKDNLTADEPSSVNNDSSTSKKIDEEVHTDDPPTVELQNDNDHSDENVDTSKRLSDVTVSDEDKNDKSDKNKDDENNKDKEDEQNKNKEDDNNKNKEDDNNKDKEDEHNKDIVDENIKDIVDENNKDVDDENNKDKDHSSKQVDANETSVEIEEPVIPTPSDISTVNEEEPMEIVNDDIITENEKSLDNVIEKESTEPVLIEVDENDKTVEESTPQSSKDIENEQSEEKEKNNDDKETEDVIDSSVTSTTTTVTNLDVQEKDDLPEKNNSETENTEFVQILHDKNEDSHTEGQSNDAEDPFGGDSLVTDNISAMETDNASDSFGNLGDQADNLQDVVNAKSSAEENTNKTDETIEKPSTSAATEITIPVETVDEETTEKNKEKTIEVFDIIEDEESCMEIEKTTTTSSTTTTTSTTTAATTTATTATATTDTTVTTATTPNDENDKNDDEKTKESNEKETNKDNNEKNIDEDHNVTPVVTSSEEQTTVLPGQDDELCIVPDSMKVVIPQPSPAKEKDKEKDENKSKDKEEEEKEGEKNKDKDKINSDKPEKEIEKIISLDDKNKEKKTSGVSVISAAKSGIPSTSENQKMNKSTLGIKVNIPKIRNVISIDEDNEASKDDDVVTIEKCRQCKQQKPCNIKVTLGTETANVCSKLCQANFLGGSSATSTDATTDGSISKYEKRCATCLLIVETDGERNLSWETMEFCNEECLGKFQTKYGSYCRNCKGPVLPTSLGKYCVRFGYDVRQFCCSVCLEEFKKGLKVCSYCQKDISSGADGFLAPVGDRGQFKDFCTQTCMEKYSKLNSTDAPVSEKKKCSVCQVVATVHCEVQIDRGTPQPMCGDPCLAAFKFVNKVNPDQCSTCKKYFEVINKKNTVVYYNNEPHTFCSKSCLNIFIISNRKIVPCDWCKVKKYNFDMIKKDLKSGGIVMMCSLNCLTLYQVSINAVSAKKINCDLCKEFQQAQYHLTMSDATIRNFCSYNCVMKFQGQYTKSPITIPIGDDTSSSTPPVVPTGTPKRTYPGKQTTQQQLQHQYQQQQQQHHQQLTGKKTTETMTPTTQNSSSNTNSNNTSNKKTMPVISSVSSLAAMSSSNGLTNSSITQKTSNTTSTTTTTTHNTTMPTSTSVGTQSQIIYKHQVITRPTSPVQISNKMTQCKPLMHTKGVSVRPHPCVKSTQTDEVQKILVPIPVPIYIPFPVHMFSFPVPIPMPFPIPIPVPIFIPTTRNSAKGIFKEIKKIQEKLPTDPFEAELVMMAEMAEMATDKKSDNPDIDSDSDSGDNTAPELGEPMNNTFDTDADADVDDNDNNGDTLTDNLNLSYNNLESTSENQETPAEEDLEVTLAKNTITAPPTLSPPPSSIIPELSAQEINETPPILQDDSQILDKTMEITSDVSTINSIIDPSIDESKPEDDQQQEQQQQQQKQQQNKRSTSSQKGKKRTVSTKSRSTSTKRNRKSSSKDNINKQTLATNIPPTNQDNNSLRTIDQIEKPDANMALKYTFGVNAWRQWVSNKNIELEKKCTSTRKVKLFKTELLQLTADELNYTLSLFVKEVRKPNGAEYAPDTIYYLCLGIQQYLFENNRIDNIFTDTYYEKFTDCLDEITRKFSVLYNDAQYIVTRVEEEHLWECKQLGAHSPHVLLTTLMFFNTKHFNLVTVDEHMQLSFSHIMKHWKKNPAAQASAVANKAPGSRNILLRFYPPQPAQGVNSKKRRVYEQQVNEENPLRCPVKLYEFYLSKCPESVKTRNDVFYLLPERSCVPDSPVWYSTSPLAEENLVKMLNRVKIVKEINVALLSS